MDIEEFDEVLHELFECGLKSSVKCEMCDEHENLEIKGLSLCVSGKLDKKTQNCIQSITERHNLKYMWIKGKGERALKIYKPK
jgi:hypothetical protein